MEIVSGEMCPFCNKSRGAVKDSRYVNGKRIRRKECDLCGNRWSTEEILMRGDFREEERYCIYCKKLFKPRCNAQKTCGSDDCKKKLNHENVKKWNNNKKPLSISEISRRAKDSGMSYGEYVTANGL